MSTDKRKDDSAAGLYLDLLKKTLTNTIYTTEPGEESEAIFVRGFIDHYIQGTAISMLPMARLDSLQACIDDVLTDNVPGDFIETGVWRGGATIFMRAMLKARGVADRTVWVADSFEGLPEPDAEKYPIEAETHQRLADDQGLRPLRRRHRSGQIEFPRLWDARRSGPLPEGLVQGHPAHGARFEASRSCGSTATITNRPSTRSTNLYDKLSVGGYAIIDDYAEDAWTHCRRAVDDFRQQRNIQEPLVQVDSKCFYWRRAA